MAKNLIPEIAKLLGVEVGEDFKIKGYNEQTYRFDADGLKVIYSCMMKKRLTFANVMLSSLLAGKDEIVKLPWKPKVGEAYWTFVLCGVKTWGVINDVWSNIPSHMAVLKAGWVYKTCAEAEAALPTVAAEMGVEYKY